MDELLSQKDPELKDKYEKHKYVVKLWEHNFKKTKGRPPSKLDIREADIQVRYAYRQYYKLKMTVLNDSFKDVDGFDLSDNENMTVATTVVNDVCSTEDIPTENTWGRHLNITSATSTKTKDQSKPKIDEPSRRLSQKLFDGARRKTTKKRNPRKSLSFSHRQKSVSDVSSSNGGGAESLSQPIKFDDDALSQFSGTFRQLSATIQTQPTQFSYENQRPLRTNINTDFLPQTNNNATFDLNDVVVFESDLSESNFPIDYTETTEKVPKDFSNLFRTDDSKRTVAPSSDSEDTKSSQSRAMKRQKRTDNALETDYDLEYDINPRVVCQPRVKNVTDLLELTAKSTNEEKRTKINRNNENFVKLDLERKRYVHGAKRKRKFHKVRTRDSNVTVVTCFNCGDSGHLARHCQHSQRDALLPLEAVENHDPPPPISTKTSDLNVETYADPEKSVGPFYTELLTDAPSDVLDALTLFGHEKFRSGQDAAILRILAGLSTLVTLSTGAGKSLCYQLPAYLYSKHRNSVTLVISPLVALMEDQLSGIPSFLRAVCVHTNQTKTQRAKAMKTIADGQLDILLISPEMVVSGEKSATTSILRQIPRIAFACIDEVHCLSQWSHNFRPSYLILSRVLRQKLGIKTILGLTATSSWTTTQAVCQHLDIAPDGVIRDVPLPDNIQLEVTKVTNRDQALLDLLNTVPYRTYESLIVYCIRREECDRVASLLRSCLDGGVQAKAYHAGIPPAQRRRIQRLFMNGQCRIIVATVAFGMGINKSDIRAVIHYNLPKNLESYVQEVGRAGRDGLEAHCHLLLDHELNDRYELKRHIYGNTVERYTLRKLLERVFVPCHCGQHCTKHEVAFSQNSTVHTLDLTKETIQTILCYLELHPHSYIQVLSPAYVTCKVISYSDTSAAILEASKTCRPLAAALELHVLHKNTLEFNVIEVAAAIGLDSGICKRLLKQLEWTAPSGGRRSKLTIQFSDLGFRILAAGNLTGDQLDQVLEDLHMRTVQQEQCALRQLHQMHRILIEGTTNQDVLKERIRDYFAADMEADKTDVASSDDENFDETDLVNSIRQLISIYRDCTFTGRAIAQIFHGIISPNYEAIVWGRCRYWRRYIRIDFHTISRIATRELLRLKD